MYWEGMSGCTGRGCQGVLGGDVGVYWEGWIEEAVCTIQDTVVLSQRLTISRFIFREVHEILRLITWCCICIWCYFHS